MRTMKDVKPDWVFVRYGTVAGWLPVAVYRLPDGTFASVRC